MDYKTLKFSQHVRFYLASHKNNDKTRIFVVQKTFNGLKVAPVLVNTKIAMFNFNSSVSPFSTFMKTSVI